jgi:hypothetical protein
MHAYENKCIKADINKLKTLKPQGSSDYFTTSLNFNPLEALILTGDHRRCRMIEISQQTGNQLW